MFSGQTQDYMYFKIVAKVFNFCINSFKILKQHNYSTHVPRPAQYSTEYTTHREVTAINTTEETAAGTVC